MSGWRGLTEPEWHETNEDGESAYCTECWDTHCSQELPCKCCGKAEVERLTARIDAALAVCGEELDEGGYAHIDGNDLEPVARADPLSLAMQLIARDETVNLPALHRGYGRDERAVGWNNLRADVLDALRGES